MKNRTHKFITLVLSLCLVFVMTAISAFAYSPDELEEISGKAMEIIFSDDEDTGDFFYSEKTRTAVSAVMDKYSECLHNAVADEKLTDEEKADIDKKAAAVKEACDAAVLATNLKITSLSKKFKQSAVRKKAQSFKIKVTTSSGAKAAFKKTSGTNKIKVSNSGKVTVKKGTKKGKYTVKVKISVPASEVNGMPTEAVTKTVTVKVTVK